MADKEHLKKSDKLDKAFGYGRLNLGQADDTDAPLTVKHGGFWGYRPPRDRPLKQRNWDEHAMPQERIGETGTDRYAQGGLVKKGSYNVPQMCKGGKVIKSWSK